MNLSIVIVSYNAVDFLRLCLSSVFEAIDLIDAEVYVVDNNSSEGVVDMVRDEFPRCNLIANKENVGFSVANNQAIKVSKGKHVLLLNPDTIVEEDTFKKVTDFMEGHKKAGGLGIKMIDGSGAFLPESKRGIPSPWVSLCKMTGLSSFFKTSRVFSEYHKGYLSQHHNHKTEILAGAFMCFKKTVLDEVGLLDEDFFMYGEDIDLSYRIVKAGYENYYFADSSIIHFKGESTVKDKKYRDRFYNAMVLFANKHFNRGYGWMLKRFINFGILSAKITSSLLSVFHGDKSLVLDAVDKWYLIKGFGNFGQGAMSGKEIISIEEHELKELESGVVLFVVGQVSFKKMIELMEEFKGKFRYRFLIEGTNRIIGSDNCFDAGVSITI